MAVGWKRLIPSSSPYLGAGNYRLDAYSEFLPAPLLGWKPYDAWAFPPSEFSEDDPHGWQVSQFEETLELQPGLLHVGKQILHKLERLIDNDTSTGIPKLDLQENPYWPAELAAEPQLPHEKLVTLLPLALSRTQDDKGRTPWTLFGNSEQGPSKAFWKSFYSAPKKEIPVEEGIHFFARLLHAVYGETIENSKELLQAGFRILREPEEELPSWTEPLTIGDRASVAKVKYLLTFRPFGKLPEAIRQAYLTAKLCLLPFPGSLTFWGTKLYQKLSEELPHAQQIPLLLNIVRYRGANGLRVPQSGFLHEPNAEHPHSHHRGAQVKNTYKRTHRWDKILRDQDELSLIGREHKLTHVLFSTIPDDLELYDKPMARNVQLWFEDGRLLLDGPNASPEQLKKAMKTVQAGGLFGYRFLFPAMQVGKHTVYWHRPLVMYRNAQGEATLLPNAPMGYLTAYDTQKPKLDKAIELWPRISSHPLASVALALHETSKSHKTNVTVLNCRKLEEASRLMKHKPLPRSFAQQLLTRSRGETLDQWLNSLPNEALATEVRMLIEPVPQPLILKKGAKVPASLTYAKSARRSFELDYWKTISSLSEGMFLNKNNADIVLDETTRKMLPYHDRQLEPLSEHLLAYYRKKVSSAGLKDQVLIGDIPFRWRTDFDYSWMGGWLKNDEGAAERDLIVMIPGKDRSRAVIMSDHYDTAYMADKYYKELGGNGARMAACGADDNHSATAAMMLAAPIFLEMSKKGLLGCDIWLIHLTGEEFPADCLGARALVQRLVERSLKIHLPGGKTKDISKVKIQGLYVSDMIAHNNDHEKDVFQISPGVDSISLWLAYQAHMAAEIWNESGPVWNKDPGREGKPRGRRSPHGGAIPEIAPFLQLNGQIRQPLDPKSTLYNTDGQMFSDAGVPGVLFMENYDINRSGYHDTHDTMENIDLDYGSAFCAITIESVARAATERPE